MKCHLEQQRFQREYLKKNEKLIHYQNKCGPRKITK